MNAINLLNTIVEGWTESQNGMLVNPNRGGGIIDVAPAIGEWFIVADFGVIEGYETREDAVEAFASLSIEND